MRHEAAGRLGSLFLGGDMDRTQQLSPGSQRGKEALPFFCQALQLDITYAGQVLHAYRQYLPLGEAFYRFAVSIPHTPQGHLKAAEVLEGEFWDQARRHYLIALALGGPDPGVLRAYGAALQCHREFAAAREIWERLRQAQPEDTTAFLGLADAYDGLGDHAAVVQTLQELVARLLQHAAYRRRLAETYLRLGKSAEAEAVWSQLTTLLPRSAAGYVGLAQLYESRRDYAMAVAMMQRVVGLEPGNIDYHRQLARLYEANGESARPCRSINGSWPCGLTPRSSTTSANISTRRGTICVLSAITAGRCSSDLTTRDFVRPWTTWKSAC